MYNHSSLINRKQFIKGTKTLIFDINNMMGIYWTWPTFLPSKVTVVQWFRS